jgi:hypothetical protein
LTAKSCKVAEKIKGFFADTFSVANTNTGTILNIGDGGFPWVFK